MYTDDCSWQDGLCLCALLEGRNLGSKGGHDGHKLTQSRGNAEDIGALQKMDIFVNNFIFRKVREIGQSRINCLFTRSAFTTPTDYMLRPILVNSSVTTITEEKAGDRKGTGGAEEKRKVHFPQKGTFANSYSINMQ